MLVGSVAGQRYWSTVLNQDATITTGTWTPDDQQVCHITYFNGIHNHQLKRSNKTLEESPMKLRY